VYRDIGALLGAEMSVFSPLSDGGDINDRATDDGRLSLTTQLLPQSSSQVATTRH